MSRRLVFGVPSRPRLRDLSPLAMVGGQPVFPIAGAEDDDSANSGEDTGSEKDADEDDDSDDDDDHDDDHDDDDDAAKDKRSRRRKPNARTSEFRRLQRERNALLKEKTEREKKDREAELAKKSEVDRAVAERDDAVKERDTLRERLTSASIELEIIKASSKRDKSGNTKYAWNDIEDVLNDRKLRSAIEIGEDGEITGVEDALKELAKRKPHFLASVSEEDDKGTTNGRKPATTATNGSTGGNPGTNNNDKGRAADRQRLNELYPALARMPQS